jgi:uncharacterized OsmC-like protein
MAGYEAQIQLAQPSPPAAEPGRWVVDHHLAGRVEISAEVLSGGHLLHLAVAGCLFNDVLREARARGIEVSALKVSATGGFDGEPPVSTGITYVIDLSGDAPEDELQQVVADCEKAATIPHALRAGTLVKPAGVRVQSISAGGTASSTPR